MTVQQLLKNLEVPRGKVDVVLDTDAYNEIDDQFALAYLLKSGERLVTKAIYAAPFFNKRSTSPENGMERSYDEILKVLQLAGRADLNTSVFKGSRSYLSDEHTPVDSPAARDLAARAMGYSAESPLYVVAIGAITNVASALLLNPDMKERVVLVWLGGHAPWNADTCEFNMMQDVAAARVVFSSGAPLVVLPCIGVVDHFATTEPELRFWLEGRNPLADYLAKNAIQAANEYAKGKPWSRVIWDVTAVAWLLNDNERFLEERVEHCPIPEYDHHFSFDPRRHFYKYVSAVKRDALFEDLFVKLTKED